MVTSGMLNSSMITTPSLEPKELSETELPFSQDQSSSLLITLQSKSKSQLLPILDGDQLTSKNGQLFMMVP